MPPDFLNSREDAIVVWSLAIITFALYKDSRGVGASIVAFVRAFFQHKLLLLFGGALVYSAGVVYVAYTFGLWHRPSMKETIYWFVGSAIALAGTAVTDGARNRREIVRSVARRILAVTVIVEFVVNVYTMPFVAELVGVFFVLALTGMQVVAKHDVSTPDLTRKAIDWMLAAVGVVYLVYFVVRILGDTGGFFTRDTLEGLLVAPVLSIVLIPYLIATATVSRWEQERLRRRFRTRRASAT